VINDRAYIGCGAHLLDPQCLRPELVMA